MALIMNKYAGEEMGGGVLVECDFARSSSKTAMSSRWRSWRRSKASRAALFSLAFAPSRPANFSR